MNEYMNKNENGEVVIDIKNVIDSLWKFKLPILGLALLAALLAIVKTVFFTPLVYTSRGELYVSNKNAMFSTAVSASMQMNDIESARKMSESSVRILKTNDYRDIVSNAIAEKTGNVYSSAYIGSHVSISADDTEILTIIASASSPEAAFEIANEFLNCAPTHLKSIFNTGDATVVDTPRLNLTPNSKYLIRNTGIAFLVGALIGAIIVFVFTIFDKKIHNGTEAAKRYDLPLLGEIPR